MFLSRFLTSLIVASTGTSKSWGALQHLDIRVKCPVGIFQQTHRFQVYVHSVMRAFPCGFYSAVLNCRHVGSQVHSTRPAPRVGHRKEVCRRCLHPLVGRRRADPNCAAALSNMVRHTAVTIPATSRLAAGARLLRFMISSTHDSKYVHKHRDMMRLPTASLNENIYPNPKSSSILDLPTLAHCELLCTHAATGMYGMKTLNP